MVRVWLRFLRVVPGVLLILGVFASVTAVSPVLAATIQYPCPSIESQLQTDINDAGPGGTVELVCPGPTTVPFTGQMTISQSVTLDASHSPGTITIDGEGTTQLFYVDSGVSFGLNSLTLADGTAHGLAFGGAIDNEGGTVTVSDSTFSGNSAYDGGAILNNGTLTITDSTFSGNSATNKGGAIHNGGTVAVSDSTFSGNSAYDGGAIYNYLSSTLTVSDSTFSGNSATFGGAISNLGPLSISHSTFSANSATYGGAIHNGDTVTVSDSTFSGNSATGRGGAIYNISSGSVVITGSTFSGNSAPGGGAISNDGRGAPLTIGGDIIANNTPENCSSAGEIYDEGYNLDTDGTCTSGQTGDIVGKDPLLAPLGDYGGPTQTMALLPGSPAIDQIPLGYSFTVDTTTYDLCPAGGTDQRGFPRPDSNDGVTETVCDIGAYEYQDTAYTIPGFHTAYDIESSNWSCSGGGTSCITAANASDCVTTTPCPGATYGDVEAFGPPNNATYGTPDELILACVQGTDTGYQIGYLDVVSHQGALDYPAGTRSYPGVYGTADSGTISGKGTLIGGGGSEDNPSQPSSVSASAYDATTGIVGSVSGIQNTDNREGANTLNSGGFRVTIRGRVWTVTTTGTTPVTTRNTTSSTMSCTVGGSHANDLRNAGIDTDALAEGELEPSLGDNQFLPIFAPHPTRG